MTLLGIASYFATGCAFLVISVLLLTKWRGRFDGTLLLAATSYTTVWAFVLAYHAANPSLHFVYIFVLETLRSAVWLTLLTRLLQQSGNSIAPKVALLINTLWISMLAYALALNLAQSWGLRGWSDGEELIVGSLLMAIIGLVLIEQIYRSTPIDQRWSLKLLNIALGLIFAYDLFLYSNTLLFRAVDTSLWYARGAVYMLAVPLLALTIARNPQWSPGLIVSRRIAFHTTTATAAAAYLLIMAVAGYYLKVYGGQWGLFLQALFFSGAIVVLVIVVTSGQIRAKIRVFVSKNFYNYKYDYREEWLRLTHALAREELSPYRRGITALADAVESRGGALFMQEQAHRFVLKDAMNMAVPETLGDAAQAEYFALLQQRQWISVLGNTDAEHAAAIPEPLMQIDDLWLIVPLCMENRLIGLVLLLTPRTPQELTWEDFDLMRIMGAQIASYVAQYESAQALVQARQFEAFSRLSTFIMHDLKNITGQLSLIAGNAQKHKHNPEFIDDMLMTVDNSVARMKRLLAQLRHGREISMNSKVRLNALLEKVVLNYAKPAPEPVLELTGEPLDVDANPDKLAAVIGNVVVNAQEAVASAGRVVIRLRSAAGFALVEIEDDGIGMDAEFLRDSLFKPFETTKGQAGMGVGAFEAREYCRELGGELSVTSQPGQGSCFQLRLKLAGATGIRAAVDVAMDA